MSHRRFASFLAAGAAALAVGATPAWAVDPSVIVRQLTVDIVVGHDGHAVITTHREQSPASSAAASQIGQMPLAFNPSLGKLDIQEAYTRKGDGTRIPVDLGGVRAQLAPGVPDVPIFQDMQQKVVVFPDLEAGDTEVITYRDETDKPLFPGQFFWQTAFAPTVGWQNVVVTVTAPADYPLRTEQFGPSFDRSEQGGMVRYVWRYSHPQVIAEDIAAVSAWDRLPRIFVSSFPNYAAMGAAYRAMSEPKSRVTPRIQARADRIVAGITDKRAQAQAIYDWVSQHIRYVALYLGNGGVEPHAAEAVMVDGYGDCKDHTALFGALLQAEGIDSYPVLVNVDNAYTLSGPPTLAQLDHVISYLPAFQIYADTTSGVAPFGTLPFQVYGKPAVPVVADLPAGVENPDAGIIRLPLLQPEAASLTTRTDAHMDLDGAIIGTTQTSATGPMAVALRLAARWVQTTGHEGAARRILMSQNEPGIGVFDISAPDGLTPGYGIAGSFTLDPQPEILDGDSFSPPVGLEVLTRPGDYLLGPLERSNMPESQETPCFAGHQTETLTLQLPQNREPEKLPQDRTIETPDFTYHSHWSLAGQTVSVRRELVSRIAQPVCAGALRHETAVAFQQIRRDERAKIALANP